MPQKNAIKPYVPNSYYHVYARGVNKQKIFLEPNDYLRFISLFDRYLTGKKIASPTGLVYPIYAGSIQLICFCLMTNHIHLLLYQTDNPDTLQKFMASVMTSYSKYFNAKYKRVGSLFESRYKAVQIDDDSYLMHISRYIHMNPRRWRHYRYSSLEYIYSNDRPIWLTPSLILDEFATEKEYVCFLQDYQENKDMQESMKAMLADTK